MMGKRTTYEKHQTCNPYLQSIVQGLRTSQVLLNSDYITGLERQASTVLVLTCGRPAPFFCYSRVFVGLVWFKTALGGVFPLQIQMKVHQMVYIYW